MMKLRVAAATLLLAAALPFAAAQTKRDTAPAGAAAQSRARYFQITVTLHFSGAGSPEERTQLITTDIAVVGDRSGSSKARLISQVPFTTSKGTTYLDLGTKLDCNDVHLDGQALALNVVLETNHTTGEMVTTAQDGRTFEEPVISQRNLSLQVRLPLGVSRVIFDSKNIDLGALKPLKNGTGDGAATKRKEFETSGSLTEIEMTAKEL